MSMVGAAKYDRAKYISEYNTKHDFKIIWDDYTHVRMLKRFESSPCDEDKGTRRYFNFRNAGRNKCFHLRTYLPKTIILNKGRTIDKCIIMINGLNETQSFALYDQLGASFAKYGVASILLPTPHHLNRMDLDSGSSPLDYLFEHPTAIYFNAKQSFHEIRLLRDKIKGRELTADDRDFYLSYFSGEGTRVSLLGYSLGGLRAVSQFLSSPDEFAGCVLVNSGFKLSDLNLRRMKVKRKYYNKIAKLPDLGDKEGKELVSVDENIWKKYHQELKSQLTRNKSITQQPFYQEVFRAIYFRGTEKEKRLAEKAKPKLGRVLLIVAGDDEVVPPQDANNMFVRSTMFRIPGIDHFLQISPLWLNWVGITVDLIIEFLDNDQKDYYHRDSLLRKLATLEDKWLSEGDNLLKSAERRFFLSQADIKMGNLCKIAARIEDYNVRQEFCHLVMAGLCFHGSLKKLVDEYKDYREKPR